MAGTIAELSALQVLFAPGEQFTGRLLKGRRAAEQAIRLRLLTTLFYNRFWGFLVDAYVNARIDAEGNILGDLYAGSIAANVENEIEKEEFVITCVAIPSWDPVEEALTLDLSITLVGDDQQLQIIETFGGLS